MRRIFEFSLIPTSFIFSFSFIRLIKEIIPGTPHSPAIILFSENTLLDNKATVAEIPSSEIDKQ